MEGLIAPDGGRVLKSGLLAFGVLISATPAIAQSAADPLAPLPTTPPTSAAPMQAHAPSAAVNAQSDQPASAPSQPQQPIVVTQTATVPSRPITVPKDWRGVFDAIDAGQWASARAGIAALPRDVLTPVATAELYIAKGSPIVDLASLEALLAEAPEIPEAEQIAALAVKRGATTPLAIVPEKPIYSIGSAPVR